MEPNRCVPLVVVVVGCCWAVDVLVEVVITTACLDGAWSAWAALGLVEERSRSLALSPGTGRIDSLRPSAPAAFINSSLARADQSAAGSFLVPGEGFVGGGVVVIICRRALLLVAVSFVLPDARSPPLSDMFARGPAVEPPPRKTVNSLTALEILGAGTRLVAALNQAQDIFARQHVERAHNGRPDDCGPDALRVRCSYVVDGLARRLLRRRTHKACRVACLPSGRLNSSSPSSVAQPPHTIRSSAALHTSTARLQSIVYANNL
jgi:hypothetical protein